MTAIVDDILIYGRTREEHDCNLRSVLDRAQEKGIRFNPEKCTIGVNQVPFFGHILADKGLITEKGYALIEKELYAILIGLKRFHQFTYGRRVTVHSDHKPISAIMRKPIAVAPPCLSRMLLQLQKYSINGIHKSGKEIPVSDFLSRSF